MKVTKCWCKVRSERHAAADVNRCILAVSCKMNVRDIPSSRVKLRVHFKSAVSVEVKGETAAADSPGCCVASRTELPPDQLLASAAPPERETESSGFIFKKLQQLRSGPKK